MCATLAHGDLVSTAGLASTKSLTDVVRVDMARFPNLRLTGMPIYSVGLTAISERYHIISAVIAAL